MVVVFEAVKSCNHIHEFDAEDPCQSKKKAMCVCDEGYVKNNTWAEAKCVPISQCFDDVCIYNEEFSDCMPQCFHDCSTMQYGLDKLCYDWENPD